MTDNPNMTPQQAAEYLHLSPRTLIRWRNMRKGPPWVKAGQRIIYRRADVDAWLARNVQAPVAEVTE
ncbi:MULTISPECIES: helix-turn-helix domain-containing protein [unclassified Thioalkalivibrio]|uniref:helix-turn-helix domain-containing protein n=1 Tax=unclassified Thioalkalivibrio TaxID=2621013 RepID=UPI00036D757A|nr:MULTISPECIES: helix-turn-helix domain-containing protein [unclassified Thioalkalivibrio]